MNPYFFAGKMNLVSKLWKQFGSFSKKDERENGTVKENRFPFMEAQDNELDDGLRWDEYGNPYILSNHYYL